MFYFLISDFYYVGTRLFISIKTSNYLDFVEDKFCYLWIIWLLQNSEIILVIEC